MLNSHLIPMFLCFCFIGPKRTTKKNLKLQREENLRLRAYVQGSILPQEKVKFYTDNVCASVTNSMSVIIQQQQIYTL